MLCSGSFDVLNAISIVGFPIVAAIACAWYCKYSSDQYRAEVKDMQKDHKEEIAGITEALNNNTLVVQKLIDKLDNIGDCKHD